MHVKVVERHIGGVNETQEPKLTILSGRGFTFDHIQIF